MVRAFTSVGVGGFIFVGALFVSNAALNNLGKPGRNALVNLIKDGVLSWPMAVWLSTSVGTVGVIYGRVAAGVVTGGLAALQGWRYVASLNLQDAALPTSTEQASRPYPIQTDTGADNAYIHCADDPHW